MDVFVICILRIDDRSSTASCVCGNHCHPGVLTYSTVQYSTVQYSAVQGYSPGSAGLAPTSQGRPDWKPEPSLPLSLTPHFVQIFGCSFSSILLLYLELGLIILRSFFSTLFMARDRGCMSRSFLLLISRCTAAGYRTWGRPPSESGWGGGVCTLLEYCSLQIWCTWNLNGLMHGMYLCLYLCIKPIKP